MKILLTYSDGSRKADFYQRLLPVGLGSMAAVLQRAGFTARVANFSEDSWPDVESFLTAEQPDIVGISVFTHNREAAQQIAAIAKRCRPGCWVICGGPHASHAVEELLAWPGVDAVVVGEGEETLLELARLRKSSPSGSPGSLPGVAAHQGKFIPRQLVSDLDALPFSWQGLRESHGVDIRTQAEFIITSRGCPAACTFCSSPAFWGRRVRFRSADSVIMELQSLRQSLGLIYLSLRDDTFTADRRRVLEICRRIRDERLYYLWNCQSRVTSVDPELLAALKLAGCETIQFGIESGSPRVLKALGKKIEPEQIKCAISAARAVGLQVSIYLMTGIPGENEGDLQQTVKLIEEVLPHDGQVSPLVYYPGTAVFQKAVADGLLAPEYFSRNPSGTACAVRSDSFVQAAQRKILKALATAGKLAAYSERDYRAQRKLLGYCHATNLQAGQTAQDGEQWDLARHEFREITVREPENPWGWLSLAELEADLGNLHEAALLYQETHRLVPKNLSIVQTLVELHQLLGNRSQKKKLQAYVEDLSRNPGNIPASEGTDSL